MGNGIFSPLKIITFVLILYCLNAEFLTSAETVYFMKPGDIVENDQPGLQIFCHKANTKYLMYMWKTLTMHWKTTSMSYDIFDGKNQQEVVQKHVDNQRSWSFNFFGTKLSRTLDVNLFEDTCIGVYVYPSSKHKYTMHMTQTNVDPWKVALLLFGTLIFWSAPRLSKNPLFYYLCGIVLGVTTSIIILLYLVSKLFPKSKMMYLMVAAGSTMSLYIAQALWENGQLIIMQYTHWLCWYIGITALISFLICYRFGPVTNNRTKRIIQWFLQIAGLTTIYYSSYFSEASLVCCICFVILYNFPVIVIQKGKKYWNNIFPERRKLLTDDEYRREAKRETEKALLHLQEFCSSPECNTWKTVLRLKDPIRFAKFMEGESHLSEDESNEHDSEITRIVEEYEYTDDDDYDF